MSVVAMEPIRAVPLQSASSFSLSQSLLNGDAKLLTKPDAGELGSMDQTQDSSHCWTSALVGIRPLATTLSLMTSAGVDKIS